MWKSSACLFLPVELESRELSKTLPDELVERIIAMMPFPFIFKARCLSKSWQARFRPIESLDDETERLLATSFQKQVRERSQNWGPFFPVCVGEEFSCAYDWASQNWVRLPSLFCPCRKPEAVPKLSIYGALLFRSNYPSARTISVANIFTRCWKELPRPPDARQKLFCTGLLMSDTSLERYKVVVFYQEQDRPEELDLWSAQMYDSKLGVWSSNKLVEDVPLLGSPAYLNGILYMVASFDLRSLLALNLEEGTSEVIKLTFHELIEIESVDVVVCHGKLLMIVNDLDSPETLRVLEIDLKKLQLMEVTRGPPAALNLRGFNIRQPVGHGDCIFFGMQRSDNPKLVYNVLKKEWSCFHLSFPHRIRDNEYGAVSFQPGLNPFLAV